MREHEIKELITRSAGFDYGQDTPAMEAHPVTTNSKLPPIPEEILVSLRLNIREEPNPKIFWDGYNTALNERAARGKLCL